MKNRDDNNIQYDEYGGYYDKDGYYYDAQGGCYDPEGGYYDPEGNYYPPEEMGYEEGYESSAEDQYSGDYSDDLSFEDMSTSPGRSIKREYNNAEKYSTSYVKSSGKKKAGFSGMTIVCAVIGVLIGGSFGAALGAVIGAMFVMNAVVTGIIGAVVMGLALGAACGSSVNHIPGRIALIVLTFLIVNVTGVYFVLYNIYNGPDSAKNLMASTIQETGQLKFVNKIFLSEEEIAEISNRNSMGTLDAEVDTGLISVGGSTESAGEGEDASEASEFDINGFEIVEVSGRTYFGKLMIINDPSRVKLTTIFDGSWKEYGETLDVLVDKGNFLAGVNGGEYQSDSNKGGSPKGLVVCEGEIQYNNPQAGDVMVGFNTDNILIIRDIGGMSASSVKDLVAELQIRDAVTFKDIADGDDNHFTKLIINSESVSLNGSGSGANPRTVIGQKADGTVLILVTDGRGAGGHLGATAADVISVMQEYGAVNAANLDGGSSSCMYHDGEYEMTSVTLYYSNASWRLPLAFVVERR